MTKNYDTVVIGGGTAGYVAAIKLSQLGQSVAVVEKSKLGGTCLNQGCIPTKSFLKSGEMIENMKTASRFGLENHTPSFDIKNINSVKDKVVNQMQNGIKYLLDKNKVDVIEGTATILGPSLFSPLAGAVSVSYEDESKESEVLVNDQVIIASGSKPIELPFLPFDHKVVLSSNDLMHLENIPQKVALIGGGVIGVEFATILSSFGSEVTLIEAADRLLIQEEKDASKAVEKSLKDKGVRVLTGLSLDQDDIEIKDDHGEIVVNGEKESYDKIIVAVGRQPNTDQLGIQNTKAQVTDKGTIEVNEYYQTKESHIYAIGDVINTPQLAHVAIEEAIIAAEHIADQKPMTLDYNKIPRCVYTSPEIASIGMTTEVLKENGIDFKTHKLPLQTIAKAVIDNGGEGFIKLNVSPSGDILGATIVGAHATELINSISIAAFMNASTLELSSATFAHPSVGEIIKEVGLDAEDNAIHV